MPVLRVEKSVLDVPIPLSKTIHQCSIIDQHLRDSDHCDSPCPFLEGWKDANIIIKT